MIFKIKQLTPLAFVLGLFLSWLALPSANILSEKRAWAAMSQENQINATSVNPNEMSKSLHQGDNGDLVPFAFWTAPNPLRVDKRGRFGLRVRYLDGSETLSGVMVEFEVFKGNGLHPILEETQMVPPLIPGSNDSTLPVYWKPEESGEYEVCTTIDPYDNVPESNEDNNYECYDVIVQEPASDTIPPIIDEFVISPHTTTEITVTLDVTATDPADGSLASGIDQIEFFEYEYIKDSGGWVAVQYERVDYAEVHNDNGYEWPLSPWYGLHPIHAWAWDQAGNHSQVPEIAWSNLIPSEQAAEMFEGEVHIYRIDVQAGHTLSATLTPESGNPDLYVWGLSGLVAGSNNETGEDSIRHTAEEREIYQIEVRGTTDASYRLNFGTSLTEGLPARSMPDKSKSLPNEPHVPVDSWPEPFYPQGTETGNTHTVYLPMTIR